MAAIIERLQAAMEACQAEQSQEALGSQAESAAEANGQDEADEAELEAETETALPAEVAARCEGDAHDLAGVHTMKFQTSKAHAKVL